MITHSNIDIVGENLSNSGKTTISKSFPVKTGENWRYLSIAYEEPFGTDQTGGHADLWVDGVRLGHLPLDMKLREILKNQVELTIEVGMPNNVPLHWIEIDNVRVFDYALVVDQLSSVLHARMCEDEHLLPHSSPKSRKFYWSTVHMITCLDTLIYIKAFLFFRFFSLLSFLFSTD